MTKAVTKEHVLVLRIIDTDPRRLRALRDELTTRLLDVKDVMDARYKNMMSNDTDWGFDLDGKRI